MNRVGSVVYGADKDIAQWVALQIPGYTVTEGTKAIGVIKGGKLVAGVTYERWNGIHLEVSIAAAPGSAWADRRTLFHLFHYPFRTLGCQAISAMISITNLASINLATKLGFESEAIIRFAAQDGSDVLVLKMYRDNCRWIRNGQGQQRANTPRPAGNSGGRGAV